MKKIIFSLAITLLVVAYATMAQDGKPRGILYNKADSSYKAPSSDFKPGPECTQDTTYFKRFETIVGRGYIKLSETWEEILPKLQRWFNKGKAFSKLEVARLKRTWDYYRTHK